MREYLVQVHEQPNAYRYVDWAITVPLRMIKLNLILKAARKPVSACMFRKLLHAHAQDQRDDVTPSGVAASYWHGQCLGVSDLPVG